MRFVPALLLLTNCVANTEPNGSPDPGDPIDQPEPQPQVADGIYAMRSNVDVTVDAVLPEPAHELVGTLHDFSVHPTHTLLDVAEDAGVPAVKRLRDDLPDYIEGKLEGWVDGEIAKVTIGGVKITEIAGNIAGLAETVLASFAIDSELTIAGASSTHRLTVIDFTPAGVDAQFPLGNLPDELVSATASCTSNAGTLTIGDHGYAIAYGQYVWQAVEGEVTAQYGASLREMLGNAIGCPSIARAISNKCYYGYCVGHEAELLEVCERGLDELVARAHDKVTSLRFDAIHFATGTATIEPGRLSNGVWTAEINAGQGLRAVPATFTAGR